jgi:leader peptidase (prepilin peptidase) / N-methyltransferase
MPLLSPLLFLIGLVIGSFLLVIVDRIPKQISPFTGRSKCDHCGHVLAWNDLVPVFSFVITRGTCRYCRKRLSFYYPFTELFTAVLFALTPIFLNYSSTVFTMQFLSVLLFALFTISVFIIIFFTDLKYGLVPFAVVIPAAILTLIYLIFSSPGMLINHIVSALGAGSLFFVLYLITKGKGMGFGDVVLVSYLGLLLGFPGIGFTLYLAFLTGAVVSLILILLGLKKLKGGTVPFGPFLISAAFISFFWAETLQQFVLSLFIR